MITMGELFHLVQVFSFHLLPTRFLRGDCKQAASCYRLRGNKKQHIVIVILKVCTHAVVVCIHMPCIYKYIFQTKELDIPCFIFNSFLLLLAMSCQPTRKSIGSFAATLPPNDLPLTFCILLKFRWQQPCVSLH